jgi:nucleoside 2-deoxyribosyltransferase
MSVERKKVIYIAGPITGVANYWEAFELAEEDLQGLGYIPLSPAHLPEGMTNEQYTRIDFAMIDSADAVLFLPGYERSEGATLEAEYCKYTKKPVAFYRTYEPCGYDKNPREVVQAWLKHDLGEVFKQ